MKKFVLALVSLVAFFGLMPALALANIQTLGGLTPMHQVFATSSATTTTATHLLIQSSGSTHTFKWDSTPWRLNQGGTGATSFATGTIPFIFNGLFSESNSNLFWDAINHRLGLGNNNPQTTFDVVGAIYSRLVTIAPAGSITVDWNSGNVQKITLNANTTFTFSNGQAGGEYKLILTQDGTGSRTATWPSNVKWPGGTAPVITLVAGGIDVINFVYDGSNYLGAFSLNYLNQQSTLINSLEAYWKLDESSGDGNDATGHGYTLTNNNSLSYSSGKINNAADGGASNTDEDLTSSSGAIVAYDTMPISLSAWVNLHNDANNANAVTQVANGTHEIAYELYANGDGAGNVTFNFARFKQGSTNNEAGYTTSLATSTWYHVVGVYDGSDLTLYVDGISRNTVAASGSGISNRGSGISIMSRHTTGGTPIDESYSSALVDEVGIWSRALTSTEVSELYNSGSGLQYPF